jgi:enoyl-CoA hydratase/carnithine racemase
MAESSALLHETIEGVALVTINRPERRNALSRDIWLELSDLLDDLRADPETRGLIVTGAGKNGLSPPGQTLPSWLTELPWLR